MKTLKFLLAAILLSSTVLISKANSPAAIATADNSSKLSMKYAVNLFIDAFAHGQFKDFEEILDKNAKLTMNRGNSINTYGKAEIIKMLEPVRNVNQNCLTTSTMLENLPGQVIVKVNMKYKTFTRVNYISMSQTNKGWRITNISSVFT